MTGAASGASRWPAPSHSEQCDSKCPASASWPRSLFPTVVSARTGRIGRRHDERLPRATPRPARPDQRRPNPLLSSRGAACRRLSPSPPATRRLSMPLALVDMVGLRTADHPHSAMAAAGDSRHHTAPAVQAAAHRPQARRHRGQRRCTGNETLPWPTLSTPISSPIPEPGVGNAQAQPVPLLSVLEPRLVNSEAGPPARRLRSRYHDP